ncbi:MAG TPA: hypothetical protein PLR86_10780 [Planctomycetota bacterium]|nr:hypothetical protein [Planctomycetota bacterium]
MLWGETRDFICSGENMLICSEENKKIGKKGENLADFRKNMRDFGKIARLYLLQGKYAYLL